MATSTIVTRLLIRRGTTADITTETADTGITKYEGELRWDTTLKDLLIYDGTNNVPTGVSLIPSTATRNVIQSTADVQELIVKAEAGQTANLQEWQDSSGTVLAYVEKGGVIKSSGRRKAVVTKTADYTATVNDEVIVCDKATAMTIILPVASGSGQVFTIKNINTGTVTIDGNGSETIDSLTTKDISQWQSVSVTDYGSGVWVII